MVDPLNTKTNPVEAQPLHALPMPGTMPVSGSPTLPAVDVEAPAEVATHLADWLDNAFDHCHYGSRNWCEGYLKNAAAVVRSYTTQQQEIDRLAAERDEFERDEQKWLEEATYEIGGAPHLWSVRAKAAERRLLDAGLDWYCGGVSPGSVPAIPSWRELYDGLSAAQSRVQSLEEEVKRLREAVERSNTALNDWLNVYAGAFCNPDIVAEAQARIGEFGTIAYIASVTAQNRDALKENGNG